MLTSIHLLPPTFHSFLPLVLFSSAELKCDGTVRFLPVQCFVVSLTKQLIHLTMFFSFQFCKEYKVLNDTNLS